MTISERSRDRQAAPGRLADSLRRARPTGTGWPGATAAPCLDAWHQQTEWEVDVAYAAGYAAGLAADAYEAGYDAGFTAGFSTPDVIPDTPRERDVITETLREALWPTARTLGQAVQAHNRELDRVARRRAARTTARRAA